MSAIIKTLLEYKAWANQLTFTALLKLPEDELYKKRQTNFGTMMSTITHVFVVDDIFRHHLLGLQHDYLCRNTDEIISLSTLWDRQQKMDAWYEKYSDSLTPEILEKPIKFIFVGGGEGIMTPEEILLHVVNHGTYHRGFISDMMYQIPVCPVANDLSVFLNSRVA